MDTEQPQETKSLDSEKTQSLLAFHYLPQAGPSTFWRLFEAFGSADAYLKQPISQLKAFFKPPALALIDEFQRLGHQSQLGQHVQKALDGLYTYNVHVITWDSPHYPQLLREIHRPPPLLYVSGDPGCLCLPQLAVVGSRHPTAEGRENAFNFSRFLAASGFVITSGLALGIDGCAHEGALAVQGKTVAVLGTGIDQLYPVRHRRLAHKIVSEGGALVTEFPLGTPPKAGHFPQRNRIISGLSLGVLVVEAAIKSGSLISARFSLQHNREVFAIPGSIHQSVSRGCHALIREGATLVEQAQDILDELQGLLEYKRLESLEPILTPLMQASDAPPALQPPSLQLSDREQKLLSFLGRQPQSVDHLINLTSMTISDLLSNLMALEIKGLVEQSDGGYRRVR